MFLEDARRLTDADVCLQDHANVVSTIADGQGDWVLLRGFDQLHNLECATDMSRIFNDDLKSDTVLRRREVFYLCFLERRHPAAEHGTAVAADLKEDLFVVPRVGVLLRRPHHGREGGPVDDQAIVGAVAG